MKKIIYPLSLLTIVISIIVLTINSSCSKADDAANNDSTDNGNNIAPTITNSGDTAIVSGTGNAEFEVDMLGKPYIITIKEKEKGTFDYLDVYAMGSYTTFISPQTGPLKAGWYSSSSFWENHSDANKEKIKITTTGQYEILFRPLPVKDASILAPVTITTTGNQLVGPLELEGTVTFDLSSNTNGTSFTASLEKEEDGQSLLTSDFELALLVSNLSDDKTSFISDYSKTIICKDIPKGRYFLNCNAGSTIEYTISVK